MTIHTPKNEFNPGDVFRLYMSPPSEALRWELFKFIKGRELMVIDYTQKITVRGLIVFSLDGLKYTMQRLGFGSRLLHVFASNAHADFTGLKQPDIRDYGAGNYPEQFRAEFPSRVTSLDYRIDIDSPNLESASDFARRIHIFLSDVGAPFSVCFSGSKGFHFRIAGHHFDDRLDRKTSSDIESLIKQYGRLTSIIMHETDVPPLSENSSAGGIDLSNMDVRGVLRVPYSIHPQTGLWCWPLSHAELFGEVCESTNRIKKYFSMENQSLFSSVKFRGLLERAKSHDWGTFREGLK